jgi:hypothetical protein
MMKGSRSWRQEGIEPNRKIGAWTLSACKSHRIFVACVELKVFDVRPKNQNRGTLCCNPQQ